MEEDGANAENGEVVEEDTVEAAVAGEAVVVAATANEVHGVEVAVEPATMDGEASTSEGLEVVEEETDGVEMEAEGFLSTGPIRITNR